MRIFYKIIFLIAFFFAVTLNANAVNPDFEFEDETDLIPDENDDNLSDMEDDVFQGEERDEPTHESIIEKHDDEELDNRENRDRDRD